MATLAGALRSLSLILRGTALAQVISLMAIPVIARLYSPAEFGKFSVVLVAVSLLATLATLQLQHAIVLPRVQSQGRLLFSLSCFGALVGGALAAVGSLVLTWTSATPDWILSSLVGCAVAFNGIALCVNALATRETAFGKIGAAAVLRVVVVVCLQLVFGLLGVGLFGLLAGYVAGEIAISAFLWCTVPMKRKAGWPKINWVRSWALLRRYRDFVIYGTAQEAMNSASQGVPVLMLSAYFGAPVAGAYAMAMRLLLAPTNLLGNALRQVLVQRFAQHAGVPRTLQYEFCIFSILVAAPVLAAFLLIPALPDLFELLMGPEWRVAGEYASWLILWAGFLIFNVPAAVVIRILRRQRAALVLNTLILATRVGCLAWGGLYWSPISTIAVLAFLGAFWNLVLVAMAWRYVCMNLRTAND